MAVIRFPRRSRWLTAARETGPILWAAPLAAFVAIYTAAPGREHPAAPTVSVPSSVTTSPMGRRELSKAELHDRLNSAAALEAQQPDLARGVAPAAGGVSDRESARFTRCGGGGGANCVIDGDTFRYRGQKIRVADINTPEVSNPQCAAEAALGAQATARFHQLLNAGPFTLEPTDRAQDKYGRALFVVTRGGESLGATLVSEGLAEEWQGYRREWC